jgi:hypothetical protein
MYEPVLGGYVLIEIPYVHVCKAQKAWACFKFLIKLGPMGMDID